MEKILNAIKVFFVGTPETDAHCNKVDVEEKVAEVFFNEECPKATPGNGHKKHIIMWRGGYLECIQCWATLDRPKFEHKDYIGGIDPVCEKPNETHHEHKFARHENGGVYCSVDGCNYTEKR